VSSEEAVIRNPIRLAYLVSHPIQYQAPLLRRIAQDPSIDLTVFFSSDFSLHSYKDQGFGVPITWDTPLTDGYKHEFLPIFGNSTTHRPLNHGLFTRLKGSGNKPAFDVLWIHGYASLNALQAMLAAKALGIPVLLRAESWLNDRPRSLSKLIAKKLFLLAIKPLITGVLPIGTLNRAYWAHYLGATFPMWTIPYAVDNAAFEALTNKAAIRRTELQVELHLDPTRPVILFASKLQPRKRAVDLLDAYLALTPNREPHPYLLFVGDGEDRPLLAARINEAAAHGIHSIRLCGFRNQSELPRFFDLATVFVLPSRHEPWGLVVNEAMAAALPVIVSDEVGCHPDLITPGVEGLVFPAGNIPALTNALRQILETPCAAKRMGQNARTRIRQWDFEADLRGLHQALAAVTHAP